MSIPFLSKTKCNEIFSKVLESAWVKMTLSGIFRYSISYVTTGNCFYDKSD